jgi:hypothetical protein
MHHTARPTPSRAVRAGVAAAAVLLAAGCATTVTGTAVPVGASSAAPTAANPTDPVAWVDDVCGSLLPFVKASTAQPQIDASDPAAAVKGLSAYLGAAVASIDESLAGLKAAGPSPVEGGDEVVTALTGALTTFRTSFKDAQTQIDAVDATDPTQVVTALPKALEPLEKLSALGDPTADLKSNPELDRAAQKAPNCQTLQR